MIGETGTQIFKALHEDGRMLVYGSLTGEPIRIGEDPRYVLAGRRILEVFWLGYWLLRLNDSERKQLGQDIIELMREGILKTSPGRKYSLEEIHDAVTQAEQTGRKGKVYLVP
ncbi:zinc-binding dehydrogenase [Streptomyces sp. NPDC007896]|uniref:zinc-binding dehydrogenase n=1 Tax=Streptomyces sp. NPDC007896 TaxID=3364784 RepID=UPI0036F05018